MVFLQLCQGDLLAESAQVSLAVGSEHRAAVERSVRNLDNIGCLETYTVGVIYVGPKQMDEGSILANVCGSDRYERFLHGLGHLIALKEASDDDFVGGLSRSGDDGRYTFGWRDAVSRVSSVFCVRLCKRKCRFLVFSLCTT